MYSHSGDMATEDFVYEPVASAELRLRSNLPEEPLDEYQGPPETVSFAVDFAAGLAGGKDLCPISIQRSSFQVYEFPL